MALGHFSIGAILSLLIFRAIDYHSDRIGIDDYLRYDIIVAFIPVLWGNFNELFEGYLLCDFFFLHCWLDKTDINDSILVSVILFGLLLLTINLINLEIGKRD